MKKILLFCIVFLLTQTAFAQSLEPRLYSNAPVDFNFLVVGYGYSEGALPDSPALGLKNPNLQIDTAILAYARVYKFYGQSAKFDIIVPSHNLYGTAMKDGSEVSRDITGLGDTKARLSFNILGAEALSLKEFSSYKQDIIIGVSIQATMPTGQYDASRLINLSTNRWALKPGIGISKSISNFTFELSADAEFYTKNSDFFGGQTQKQDPVYSTQTHFIYDFGKGLWIGVDANYYWGGDYSTNGTKADTPLSNSRLGATIALPINRKNSIKLYGHRGISTITGTNFDTIGLAWQYRWAKDL